MLDWSKTALIFPGQGSQVVGMGADFYNTYPIAQAVFDEANTRLGTNFTDLMFNGPADTLNDTYNTQTALFVHSIALLRTLRAELPEANPAFLAGHSLGEFTALTAAGALSFPDGLHLVRERGRLMREAGEKHPGAMAALLGVDVPTAQAICTQATEDSGQPVVVANDNCPGQIVLSGDIAAIDRAIILATEKGAKKAIKLSVSVAAHSPLMQSASEEFREKLTQTDFHAPSLPVYGNVSAAPLITVEDIRHELDRQLTQSVRWTESIEAMRRDGAEIFIEVGAGEVLTGLVKRIDRSATRYTLSSVADLQTLRNA